MIEPRPYQTDGIERIREEVRKGSQSIVFVLPTGGGKLICAAIIIEGALRNGSKLLFCAHRKELIVQAYEKMIEMDVPESKLGIIMANGVIRLRNGRSVNATRKDAPIQIASIDTLRHRYLPEADIIFIDEAHRAMSVSYVNLRHRYPNAIHLGLTATPFRSGGKGLGSYYASLVVGAYPSTLIAGGFIVNPQVWTVPTDQLPDTSKIKTKNGDFDNDELAKACDKNKLVGSMVEHWKQRAEGRRTVAFAVNVAHSRHIVSDFLAAGVPAEHLDANTSADERFAILDRLSKGETLVVSNVGVLCEGWDMPSVKCLILGRPTKSLGLYLQQAGRILRPWNDVGALILDHAGCARKHGLPSDDREYSLEDSLYRKSDSTQCCTGCFAIFACELDACPACGKEVVKQGGSGGCGERGYTEVDGQLVRIDKDVTIEERRTYWDDLCRRSVSEKHKPGWVKSEFKKKFGHYPPKSYPPPAERPRTPGEIDVLRAKMARVARERGLPGAWVDKKVTAATTPAQAQLVLMSHVGKATSEPPVPRVAAVIVSRVETVVPESEIGKWDI